MGENVTDLFRYEMALLVASLSLTASLWKITEDDNVARVLRLLNIVVIGGAFLVLTTLWLMWLPKGIASFAGNDKDLVFVVIHYLLIYAVVFAMFLVGSAIFWTPRAVKL